jgi:peptidoglycan/xylan/chitin deacetylase (PgdA/CDA1 family)
MFKSMSMLSCRSLGLLCFCGCPTMSLPDPDPVAAGVGAQIAPTSPPAAADPAVASQPPASPAATWTKPTNSPTPETSGTTLAPVASLGDSNSKGATNASSAVAFPALQFISNPSGSDPNAMVLSFDDGPDGMDGGQTAYILDQLKTLGIKSSFYVCGRVYTDVSTDPQAQRDIQRMVAEGHTLGSHTMRHPRLGNPNTNVMAEMNDNQNMVSDQLVLGPAAPAMATYRAPFGDPFQTNMVEPVTRVAPMTQQFGVHVGWSITSDDVGCAALQNPNAACIVNNVKAALDKGRRGIILMHSVYRITGDALPAIVAECQRRGLHFTTADQLIEAKYGATPEAIMAANKKANFTPAQIAAAALAQGKLNNDSGTAP